MKSFISTTFISTIIFTMLTISTQAISFRHGMFTGACGSKLIDVLHLICGSAGTIPMGPVFFRSRYYRNRHGRHHRQDSRRGKREVADSAEFYDFEEEQWEDHSAEIPSFSTGIAENYQSLYSRIKFSAEANTARATHRRVRRQISLECCKRSCSYAMVKRNYCWSRG